MSSLESVAQQFDLNGNVTEIKPYGSGNINRTYLLTTDSDPPAKTILQRINTTVFKQPRQIVENMVVITRHMEAQLGTQDHEVSMWRTPRIIMTRGGENCFIDQDGHFWRAISFIDSTVSFETVRDEDQAQRAGKALGRFHRLTGNLDPKKLHDTLPGFHHTPEYLSHYDHIRSATKVGSNGSLNYARFCADFIEENRKTADVLENAKREGRLIIRTIHGDPKISNMLFDKEQGEPVSLIDLDTVKPGLLQYDIGDFLRSVCNPAGEEAADPESVYFDVGLCRAGLKGYFPEVSDLLTRDDVDAIFGAIRLIAFELGLRFYTDFLEGDVYFRADHESHNLLRAAGQFRLVESILKQESEIQSIIKTLSK